MAPKKTAAQIRSNATDAQILAARFPNMSKSARLLNSGLEICKSCKGSGCSSCNHGTIPPWMADERAIAPQSPPSAPKAPLVIRLVGQVRGGKNAMGVTKSGRHYAKAPFQKWRAEMTAQINRQDVGGILISEPTNVRIDYVAGDRKRRDQTGIFDAIFHLLEYAQVVADDSLLWVTESTRSYSKESPGATITFL